MLKAVGIGVCDVEVYGMEICGMEVCGVEVYGIEVVKDLANKLHIRSVVVANYRDVVPVGNTTAVLKVCERLVNIDLEDRRGEGKSLYAVGQR
jgi:hypothetical protein